VGRRRLELEVTGAGGGSGGGSSSGGSRSDNLRVIGIGWQTRDKR
jgi:hypothetical protein